MNLRSVSTRGGAEVTPASPPSAAEAAELEPQPTAATPKRSKRSLLWLCALIVLISAGGYMYLQRGIEQTDDAQIDADVLAVAARIAGSVRAVHFEENQPVKAGQLLAELDDARARARLSQAQANLSAARAAAQAAELQAQAHSKNVEAQAKWSQSNQDAPVNEALARAEEARAAVGAALAQLELAEIDLSYTRIYAPAAGVASKKTVNIGQNLAIGQAIVQLVPQTFWVTANFKETQLAQMRAGQRVRIDVDSYPDHTLRGVVQSFSAATGSRFALLPPDNASGNFTKVVQRVSVRIALENVPSELQLRPGMSVGVQVDTRPRG